MEPVFGQIKQARGFRQFLLRGVKKVRAEWAMICTTHNLLKLFTLAKAPEAATAQQMPGRDAYLDGLLEHRNARTFTHGISDFANCHV